jgi:hypothetical protein
MGIGFSKNRGYKNTETLGSRIVTSLTEQIDGEIEVIIVRELLLKSFLLKKNLTKIRAYFF